MSLARLLRSELVAEIAAEVKAIRLHNEAVRLARKNLPPRVPPTPAPAEPAPATAAPPTAEPKAAAPAPKPRPAEPRPWWEERCWFRQRTAADDAEYARHDNNYNEDDDPLGIYR
jgi:hypothetical protein